MQPRHKIRLGIVDDDESVCRSLQLILAMMGFAIECIAHNGWEIVQMVREGKHPDLLILDYEMPIMNGIEALDILAIEAPEISILFATANDSVEEIVKRKCANYIAKPFSIKALSQAIDRSLRLDEQGPSNRK